MTRMQPFALIALLALFTSGRATAQSALTVRPGSKVILLGRSNVHSWSCATSTFQANITLDSSDRSDGLASGSKSVVRLTVMVPVKSLDCGRKRMNEDLFRALKADAFPEIRYVLTSYDVNEHATADSITVYSVGELTVAGKTQRVAIQVKGARDRAGGLRGNGGVKVLMTDFGIKPPTAFFGAIRTKDALEVRVEIRVSRSDVAAWQK